MAIKQYLRKGKKFYDVHVKIRINGKQVNRYKKGLTSTAMAKRMESKLRLDLERLLEAPKNYTWEDWVDECLRKMRLQYRNSTVIGYESSFKKWVTPHLKGRDLEEISSSDIHKLLFDVVTDVSPFTRKNILKNISRIFTMAIEEQLINRNPAVGIKVKVSEKKKLVLTNSEIDILLNEGKKLNQPFFDHWVVALFTGMRSGELYALKWSDIDFESNVISVTKSWSSKNGVGPTKNSMNRTVPISAELKHFLLKLKMKSSSDYVLEKSSDWTKGRQAKILKSFCLSIGITPIRFHDLRATFITQLLLKGEPVAKVMAIVGHSELKTTMAYLRLVGKDVMGVTESLDINIPDELSGNVVQLPIS